MDRRHLLKLLALAPLAPTIVKTALELGETVEAEALVEVPKLYYKSTTYTIGFTISKQIIEDDLYGKWSNFAWARDEST